MIALQSLQLQNFRSFREAAIQFPPRGLFLIKGKDVETGESSGTGKSAVFLSLAYLLDILPSEFNAKALQNWDTEDELQVTGVFMDGDQKWVLGRGKKTFVKTPDGKTRTGAKAYAEEVRSIFGMTPDVLQALTYRPQGKPGFFLGMGPADKVRFLTDILGLQVIEDAVRVAQDRIKGDEPLLPVLQQRVQAVVAEFQAEKDTQIPDAKDPTPLLKAVDTHRGVQLAADAEILKLETRLQVADKLLRQERASAAGDKKLELQQAQALRKALQQDTDQQARDRQLEASALQLRLQPLLTALAQDYLQGRELQRLQAEVQAAEDQVCPTCGQAWRQTQERLAATRDRIRVLETEIALRPRRQEEVEDLQAQLRRNAAPRPPDPRLERLEAVEQHLGIQLANLTMASDTQEVRTLKTDLAGWRGSHQQASVALAASERELAQVTARNEARESLLQARNVRLDRIRAGIRDTEQKLRNHEQILNQEKDFVAALGRDGFLGIIFEDILAEIAADANRRFARLANVREVSLEFATETEAGRRQIKAFVTVRGHRGRPDVICSGGMLTSVEQVVDMAVIAVIGRRCAGRLPAWICLDEVTNGQGPVTKEAALEVLREAAADRLVLVIDHGTEFKEAFESTLDVEFQAGTSRVNQKGPA